MRVFKYRGGDEEVFRRDLLAIEKNYFWGSNFEQLNDPCETLISSDKFKSLTKTFVKLLNKNSERELKKVHEALDNVIGRGREIGIYSLSASYNDELLWAHYANSHKGFCIEYDLDLLLETYPTDKVYSFPIKYSKNPPEVDVSDVSNKEEISIVKKLAGNKSRNWGYEKEYRVITQKSGEHPYNYRAVKAIYFGLRMPNEWKDEMMNTLKGRGIAYYQINQVQGKYLFERELVPDINGNQITYLSEIPKSDGSIVNYRIIEKDYNRSIGKATISIELAQELTEDELKWIAQTIKDNLFSKAERVSMLHYVNGQLDEDIAWATTNFEGDQLSIFVNEYVRLS